MKHNENTPLRSSGWVASPGADQQNPYQAKRVGSDVTHPNPLKGTLAVSSRYQSTLTADNNIMSTDRNRDVNKRPIVLHEVDASVGETPCAISGVKTSQAEFDQAESDKVSSRAGSASHGSWHKDGWTQRQLAQRHDYLKPSHMAAESKAQAHAQAFSSSKLLFPTVPQPASSSKAKHSDLPLSVCEPPQPMSEHNQSATPSRNPSKIKAKQNQLLRTRLSTQYPDLSKVNKADTAKFTMGKSAPISPSSAYPKYPANYLDHLDRQQDHYSDSYLANRLAASYPSDNYPQIPERLFMSTLVKHTVIALAIIVPLAAVTAYAATPNLPASSTSSNSGGTDAPQKSPINPSLASADTIITASKAFKGQPTAVDQLDLARYAGVWYEIGRLPMYFQRKCASDVTATYTPKPDSNAITVLNQCKTSTGEPINASGQATPVDGAGSKLKVSFLPSWLRWAPFGKADYWVLAIDTDYQSALVGTPNKKYLWLLSRSPQLSEQTYQKYRHIAENQGYDLSEFKLTNQSASSSISQ